MKLDAADIAAPKGVTNESGLPSSAAPYQKLLLIWTLPEHPQGDAVHDSELRDEFGPSLPKRRPAYRRPEGPRVACFVHGAANDLGAAERGTRANALPTLRS
jgi:hypothetical protein